jgi:hypothetical protein
LTIAFSQAKEEFQREQRMKPWLEKVQEGIKELGYK